MALESATYVSGLVQANPPGTDAISQGDDHIRLIKKVLLNSFPNADAALNAIHTKATAPSSTSAGLIWFDTTANVLKVRDETNSSWITLGVSPVTSFKLLGSDTVGWTLPTAEGTSGYALTTTGSGALTFSEIPSLVLLKVTHAIQSASSYMRSETYVDTGFTITHNKLSATSTLYVQLDMLTNFSFNFDSGSINAYMRLANSVGTLIVNTTDDIRIVYTDDVDHSGNPTWDNSFGNSRLWKVLAADCPDGTTGNNEFQIWQKMTNRDDGGVTLDNGTMMVWEVEE